VPPGFQDGFQEAGTAPHKRWDSALLCIERDPPPARRRYQIAELETGATLAALNAALEWRGIEPSNIVAVRCRPPALPRGDRRARYRVIYAR
jgi:hypothetical protein